MVRIVTIDGPSGSGKGTLGQRLASQLGWHFLDSGALYRVLGLAAERRGLRPGRVGDLVALAGEMNLRFRNGRAFLDDEDVSEIIRTEAVGSAASRLAAIPEIRGALLGWQRAYAREPGLVADGRDMGSVVFPDAQVKIFLTASPGERARRRYNQLKEKGLDVNLKNIVSEIEERDRRDSSRAAAPLQAPAAALRVESTELSIDEVYSRVLRRVSAAFPDLELT